MTAYFASDVHLRLDRPERGRRFARLGRASSTPDDRAPDRRRPLRLLDGHPPFARPSSCTCEGLRALADSAAAAGRSTILAGQPRPLALPVLRAGARRDDRRRAARRRRSTACGSTWSTATCWAPGSKWKSLDGGPDFFRAFGQSPHPSAGLLDQLLEWKNHEAWTTTSAGTSGRLPRVCRRSSAARPTSSSSATSIAPSTTMPSDPRMIVLGGWQDRSSFLRIDPVGGHVPRDGRRAGGALRRRPPRRAASHPDRTESPHLHEIRPPPAHLPPLARQHHRPPGADRTRPHDRPRRRRDHRARLPVGGRRAGRAGGAGGAPARLLGGRGLGTRGPLPGLRAARARRGRPGIALAELLPVVRRHGAAIVAAHPFRWDQPFDEIVATHGPVFDALELVSNNVTRETRARTESRASTGIPWAPPAPATPTSSRPSAATYTEFDPPIETIADFVAALRSRTSRPGHRQGVRLASGPVGE